MRCLAYTDMGNGPQCSREVSAGNYCWQHQDYGSNNNIVSSPKNKVQSPKNLNKLPTDIYTALGSFVNAKDIQNLKNSQKTGISNNFYLQNNMCAEVSASYDTNVVRTELEKLYKINPHIKDLKIQIAGFYKTYLYNKKTNTFDISPISKFKNLEALTIKNEFFTVKNPAITNWQELRNLKYLNFVGANTYVNPLFYIIDLLPKLEYVNLEKVDEIDDVQWIAPQRLKTLEIGYQYEWNVPFEHFQYITRLIIKTLNIATHNFKRFAKNLMILQNLEVLDITGNMLSGDLNLNNLKFLKLRYVSNDTNEILESWNLNNLEYVSFLDISDFLNSQFLIKKYLPKLKYIEIQQFLFSDIDDDDDIAGQLEKLKNKHPKIMFNIVTIKKADDIRYSEFQLSSWDKINKLYNLSDLRKTNTFSYTFTKPRFIENQWLTKNGYYVKNDCEDAINLKYDVVKYGPLDKR